MTALRFEVEVDTDVVFPRPEVAHQRAQTDSPVDGTDVLLFSQPHATKVASISRHPLVSLHLLGCTRMAVEKSAR
jgi:hypothetical protein